jgi:antitoxin component of RelBE/YafQ-DinJ toxin-antitoxin module
VYNIVIMSNSTVLNTKIDKNLKADLQAFAKSLGLPVSTVATKAFEKILAENKIVFQPKDSSSDSEHQQVSPEIAAELLSAFNEKNISKNYSPEFSNADQAMAWLNDNED